MASGADTQTHTHTNARTKTISRNQVRAAEGRAPGLKISSTEFPVSLHDQYMNTFSMYH